MENTSQPTPIVIRFGAFGDMIMLLPMLRWLASRHGGACDVVSSGGWTKPLLTSQSCVNDVHLVTSRNAPYWLNRSQQDLTRWLREQTQRPVFMCQTGKKPHLLLSRGEVEAGLISSSQSLEPVDGEHWVQRWLRLAGADSSIVGVNKVLNELSWIDIPASAQEDCTQWLEKHGWHNKPLILLQPGNKRTMRKGKLDRSSNVKFWPTSNWMQLAQTLLDQHSDAQILLCGSPEEADMLDELASMIGNTRAASVARELPIPRLLALLDVADGMISVDTGPAHAAAAVGCPLAVLFGPHDTRLWRPWAWKSDVQVVQNGDRIASIPLDDVIQAWNRLAPLESTQPQVR